MIKHKRQIDHRADGDRVINDDDALLQRAHAQNSTLRLVDDGKREQRATHAVIRQRESPTLHVVRPEFLRAGAACQLIDRARHRQQGQIIRALDHGDDQTHLPQ